MTQHEALLLVLQDYKPHTLIDLTDGVEALRCKPCTQTAISARWRELPGRGYATVPVFTRPTAPNTYLYQLARPKAITTEEAEKVLNA